MVKQQYEQPCVNVLAFECDAEIFTSGEAFGEKLSGNDYGIEWSW